MKLTFDPMTIQHLGFRMYSQLPNALAELVANSYDADATTVDVIIEAGPDMSVTVKDNGHGMSDDELQSRYLVIGRNRVSVGEARSESGRRRAAGRKGLGKLAPFGIGTQVTVRTKRAGADQWTVVELDWEEMIKSSGEYEPQVTHVSGPIGVKGTSVEVRRLKRKTQIEAQSLAVSLSRLFNYTDSDFVLRVRPESGEAIEVDRELRYESIAQENAWVIPDQVPLKQSDELADKVDGIIIASQLPLPTNLRGITIYVNGRLANDPEFYGASESSFASAYLTGHINANYLDDLADDVVATDRRSIAWEMPEPAALQKYIQATLRRVSLLWRATRKQAQKDRLRKELNVDPEAWVETINGPERDAVADVLEVLTSPDSQIGDSDRSAVVESLRTIAPEYADLHWRHIHPAIQRSCRDEYEAGNYHAATVEAIKSYVRAVEAAIGHEAGEISALNGAFGGAVPRVDVMAPWVDLQLGANTRTNIRKAQHELSTAAWTGFRNPIQHEERRLLHEHEIFTYQDCLDALSLVSHLRRRLDGAAVPPIAAGPSAVSGG